MAIRIERNEQGNCINFHGATNPTYWNSCLSAQVDATDTDSINVINDIITSQTGVTQYEFYKIPFTQFIDAEGNAFSDATTTAAYITEKANVVGLGGGGNVNVYNARQWILLRSKHYKGYKQWRRANPDSK